MDPPQVRDILRTGLQILIARVRMEIRNGVAAMLAGSTVLNITSYKGQRRGQSTILIPLFTFQHLGTSWTAGEANLETPSAHYHCLRTFWEGQTPSSRARLGAERPTLPSRLA